MCIECSLPTVSVWQLLRGVYNLLKDPVVYAMSSRSFADVLKKEVGRLENEARRVDALAQAATNNLRNLNEVFTEWKERADKAPEDAQKRWEAFEDSKSCCYGRLPNPYRRYKFSTEAEAEIKVIRDLTQDSIRFRGVEDICLVGPAPAPTPARREGKDVVQSITTTKASVLSASMSVKLRDRGVFESRASMIQNIMDALADNSKSVVAVYGMGGVGKSTLLEDVKSVLAEERSFDWVAKADVSKIQNIETIQGEIADALGLTDIKNKETISGRAELLHNRLEKEGREKKKVLIILDNLWQRLDLKLVGIPCGPDNKAIGCKLLLTSRDQHLLHREMGCDKAFPLGGLEKEEAKRLFESMVEDKARNDDFKPWVKVALDRCAGVPFLIVAMAKRFKNAELFEWKDALRNMEKFNHEEINALIDDMLKWSYDNLKDEEKALLRLCVVCGVSKPSLEYLVRYGFGLGLFQQVSSMEEAGDRLQTQVRALQASSLLLDSEDVDGFKIHDLVREFVASASSRDHPFLVLEGKAESVLPKDMLESCEAMCFPNMKELPRELNCPELRILLLSTKDDSLHIPDSYFNSMRKLAVLNLISIHLTRSQKPFQFLENLHTLCLQSCSLENVAILGKLQGLQILSIVDSPIQQLPKEIGQLVELKSLNLRRCSQLKMIAPGVLGSLTKLEELYMEKSFDQWNAVEQTPPTNASLIELNHMENLRTLHVSIPNPSLLTKDLNFNQLTKYRIQIGYVPLWHWSEYEGSRKLVLYLESISDILQKECMQSILPKTDDLFFYNSNGAEQSICWLPLEGFRQLKHVYVENNPSIRYILEQSSLPAFKALETLILKDLANLERICHNHISIELFRALKVVRVESCDKMGVLFPRSVVRELPHLEEIEVVDCKSMWGIVEADGGRGKFVLPKLRVLKLHDLPNIQNFITTELSPSSSTSYDQVSTQIAFFNGRQVDFPRLETLEISCLGNLRFMFSPSMIKSLIQLRKLSVSYCNKMEAVIMEEEGLGMETSETLAFSMLTDLSFRYLKSLTCFSHGSQEARNQDNIQSRSTSLFNREVAFPSLKTLEASGLSKVGFLFSPSRVKSLTKLRKLTVSNCKKMEAIVMKEEGLGVEISENLSFPMLTDLCLDSLESLTFFYREKCSRESRNQNRVQLHSSALFNREIDFPKLETLEIHGLSNLGFIFYPSMIKSLAQLRKLSVSCCDNMKAIIAEEEWLGMEISETLAFPVLIDLSLDQLKSLTCFSCEKCSREGRSPDDVQSRSSALFNRKVSFPLLESLTIIRLPNLKKIWSDESPLERNNLRSLEVMWCESLLKVISSMSLVILHKLQTLCIRDCDSVQEIFDLEGASASGYVQTWSDLTKLELTQLGSLKCIWNKNPHGIVSFHKLKELDVSYCENLGFLFFPSMVKSLAQLRVLFVNRCNKMDAIISEEEGLGLEIAETLSFPMLTNLHLASLESLTSFSRGKCSREARNEDSVNSHSAALFSREVAFPSLEELYIMDMGNINMIWDDQVVVDSFSKLNSLDVDRCNKLVNIVPSIVLRRLVSLERLQAQSCYSLEVVFELQPLDPLDGHPVAHSPLKELKLFNLPELKCIWDKELHCQVKFQCLRSVSVSECQSLKSLFPASVARDLIQLEELKIDACGIVELNEQEGPEERSINVDAIQGPSHEPKVMLRFAGHFQHLKTLHVSYCDGISKMFTPTMATNLVALTELRIRKCGMLTEVISDEGGRERHVVAFNQLKCIELDGLIELRCFDYGGSTLMLPLLKDVIVTECPNMKFFSKGPIEAPKLERVQVSYEA